MNVTTYGLDLAKRVFQVHWVEPDTGELKRKTLPRADVAAFFARRAPGIVAMESCGSAHYWGRLLSALGHEYARLRQPRDGQMKCGSQSADISMIHRRYNLLGRRVARPPALPE